MSTLSSASTDAQVWSAYDDNASFEEDSSPTKAAAFITACKILLRRRPQMMTVDGRHVQFEAGMVKAELDRALQWYAVNRAGTGGIRFIDFGGIRD